MAEVAQVIALLDDDEADTSAVSRVMLDNMSLEDMAEAVRMFAGRVETEASGNVTLETVHAIGANRRDACLGRRADALGDGARHLLKRLYGVTTRGADVCARYRARVYACKCAVCRRGTRLRILLKTVQGCYVASFSQLLASLRPLQSRASRRLLRGAVLPQPERLHHHHAEPVRVHTHTHTQQDGEYHRRGGRGDLTEVALQQVLGGVRQPRAVHAARTQKNTAMNILATNRLQRTPPTRTSRAFPAPAFARSVDERRRVRGGCLAHEPLRREQGRV